MTKIIKFDLARRRRREAQRADQAAAANIFATSRQMLDGDVIGRAHQALADVLADGLPSASMGEPGGGGGHGDPTASAVLSNERHARLGDELRLELERAQSAIVHAFRIATTLAGLTVAPADADPPGAGCCARCDTWVPGTASARIRSGLCGACYQAWRRAGHPEPSTFNRSADEDDAGPVA